MPHPNPVTDRAAKAVRDDVQRRALLAAIAEFPDAVLRTIVVCMATHIPDHHRADPVIARLLKD